MPPRNTRNTRPEPGQGCRTLPAGKISSHLYSFYSRAERFLQINIIIFGYFLGIGTHALTLIPEAITPLSIHPHERCIYSQLVESDRSSPQTNDNTKTPAGNCVKMLLVSEPVGLPSPETTPATAIGIYYNLLYLNNIALIFRIPTPRISFNLQSFLRSETPDIYGNGVKKSGQRHAE